MDGELQSLIDDPRFQEYHRESLQREFNTFDVLRYADYEIRHSNVLAWLLQPAETHGIDSRFLQWFVKHVNERLLSAPLPTDNLEAANVSVERELDHVDITIFFKKEQCLVAIENKTGPATSDHLGPVTGYHTKLRDKYEDHTVKSVLLTTSPDSRLDFPDDIVHVGWKSVHGAIGSLQEGGKFRSDSVEAFVRQYRELLERQFGFTEGGGIVALLNKHHSILKKMLRLLEKDGTDSVREQMPEDRAEYRDTLVRLVQVSRQDPKRLRKAVVNYLRNRACTSTTWLAQNAPKWYSVSWTDKKLEEPSRILGGKCDFLRWSVTFTHRAVGVGFYLYRKPGKEQENPSPLDRLKHFIKDTPIDRLDSDKYSIKDLGFGWHRIYYQPILPKDEFADLSVSEGQDEVLRWLKDFMGSNESDYRRIDDYFQCLAFRPDVSTSTREESS